MEHEQGVKIQKQINLAQSCLNTVQNEHCGDKELIGKLAQLHTNEITENTLKLIKISKIDIKLAIQKAREWADFLESLS